MPLRVKLTEGEPLLIDVDLNEWNKAFKRAAASNSLLEIEDSQGRILAINPDQVLYLESVSAEELAAARQEHLEATTQ